MTTSSSSPSPYNNATCVDIAQFMWRTSKDLTTLQSTKIVFSIVYALIITLSVMGNACVVIAVARNKVLHSVRNMFIVSLSLSDICVSTISGYVTPTSVFSKEWHFGVVLCTVLPILQGMSLSISTFTLTMIAVDRYILIVHPTYRPISVRQASIVVVGVWLMAMALCVPKAIHQQLKREKMGNDYFCGWFCMEDFGTDNNFRVYYSTAVTIMQFLLPLVVISGCYTAIFRKLSNVKSKVRGSLRPQSVTSQSCSSVVPATVTDRRKIVARRRHRTNIMLVLMVIAFVCSWTPNTLFWAFYDRGLLPAVMVNQTYICTLICHSIAMTSTLWNPCLYAVLNEQLRNGAIDCLPICAQRYIRHLAADAPVGQVGLQTRNLRHRGSDFDESMIPPTSTTNLRDTGSAGCTTPMLFNATTARINMDPNGRTGSDGDVRRSIRAARNGCSVRSNSHHPTVIVTRNDEGDDDDDSDQVLL